MRGDDGHFVVYAVGPAALLAVVGNAGLNLAWLHMEVRSLMPHLTAVPADAWRVAPGEPDR